MVKRCLLDIGYTSAFHELRDHRHWSVTRAQGVNDFCHPLARDGSREGSADEVLGSSRSPLHDTHKHSTQEGRVRLGLVLKTECRVEVPRVVVWEAPV